MDFGIMFFSSATTANTEHRYRLLLEGARYADANGFKAVWTPERHFHAFGGLFPNPSVTSAALAVITENLMIRSGSLISPLHHVVRFTEEWSVVDNLSNGRAAISFGSGWNANDFVFRPENYARRREIMFEQIETARRLWRGNSITLANPFQKDVEVRISPPPIQPELPIWITTSGNPQTYIDAGRMGANLLTHLITQDLGTLRDKIQLYREARAAAGLDPDEGIVSLMLHTFLGEDMDRVKQKVYRPFREYLRTGIDLEQDAIEAGGHVSGGMDVAFHEISEANLEALLDITFQRYFATRALMGTPESCEAIVWRLEEAGVNEVACLIDFMDDHDDILDSLKHVKTLLDRTSAEAKKTITEQVTNAFLDDLDGE